MSTIHINTDGGARGNPGPAAIGVVFFDESENIIFQLGQPIGSATNNIAEYRAIVEALEILKKSKWLKDNQNTAKIICRLDSQLVIEQICGRYRVKNEGLKPYFQKLLSLIAEIKGEFTFQYVSRTENQIADKLVNLALDGNKKITRME